MTVGFGYAWEGNPGITCITNGTLYEYLGKELSVYLCPTFAQRRVSGSSNPVRSYSMNLALHWINVFDANYRPSQTILFGDEALSNSPVDKADSAFFADTQFGGYHGNGWGNVVYADGHVDRRR
jgi:prepilin-type processing-associated H-X9-DG protein